LEFLKSQIADPKPILLGFCYGGVLAIDVGRIVSARRVILVSGISDVSEIALLRRFLAIVFYITPEFVLKILGAFLTFLVNRILKINIKIPRLWLKSGQNKFIIRHLLNFRHHDQDPDLVRIHGDRDRLFPMNGFEVDFTINSGGHFMFVDRRKEVLSKIKAAIEKNPPKLILFSNHPKSECRAVIPNGKQYRHP
jgi:hypothetical protein